MQHSTANVTSYITSLVKPVCKTACTSTYTYIPDTMFYAKYVYSVKHHNMKETSVIEWLMCLTCNHLPHHHMGSSHDGGLFLSNEEVIQLV